MTLSVSWMRVILYIKYADVHLHVMSTAWVVVHLNVSFTRYGAGRRHRVVSVSHQSSVLSWSYYSHSLPVTACSVCLVALVRCNALHTVWLPPSQLFNIACQKFEGPDRAIGKVASYLSCIIPYPWPCYKCTLTIRTCKLKALRHWHCCLCIIWIGFSLCTSTFILYVVTWVVWFCCYDLRHPIKYRQYFGRKTII